MRGDQHALISLFTTAMLLAPWAFTVEPQLIALVLFGVFVGSLAPDADAADAAIFHGRIRGLNAIGGRIVGAAAVVLPVFGYTIRYLIYLPLSLIFWVLFRKNYRHQHRGLLHSLVGVALTTLILLCYLLALSVWLGRVPAGMLAVFGASFFVGCILHLVEDSCTTAGVAWLFPLSRRRICGRVRPMGLLELRPAVFVLLLGAGTAALVVARHIGGFGDREVVVASVAGTLLLWMLFLLAARVQCRCDRRMPAG